MNRRLLTTLPWLVALPLAAAEAPRSLRDPMQPPAVARTTAGSSTDAPAPVTVTARHLLVVDGHRYVVDGSRRRAVGELLGEARIERIEDAAVVVRHATGTKRLPLFSGVVKQPAADTTAVTRTDKISSPGARP